jgi:tyrosinase-like protein/polyphenol oxidase-like protein
MGHLGYAARDPIFYAHHCNIDKIWSKWNALSATRPSPAYRNPTDPAFLSERWNFYDEKGRVVSISAGDVLNYSSYLRYSYPRPTTAQTSSLSTQESPTTALSSSAAVRTAPVVNIHEARLNYSGNNLRPGPALDVSYRVKTSLIEAAREQSSVAIVLRGVPVPENATGVFDIVSVRGNSIKHLGTLAVVADAMRMGTLPKTVVLDATDAVDDLVDASNPARIAVVPREGSSGFTLRAEDMDLRVISRQ